MYKIQKTQKRYNTNIPWAFEKYPTSANFLNYFKKIYIDTKKLIYQDSIKMSNDKLSYTTTQVWNSKKDFLDFLTDDYLYNERIIKTNYDINYDIVSKFVIEKN